MSTQDQGDDAILSWWPWPLVVLEAKAQVSKLESSSIRKGQAEVGCRLCSPIFLADAWHYYAIVLLPKRRTCCCLSCFLLSCQPSPSFLCIWQSISSPLLLSFFWKVFWVPPTHICLYPFGGHIACILIHYAWLCYHSIIKYMYNTDSYTSLVCLFLDSGQANISYIWANSNYILSGKFIMYKYHRPLIWLLFPTIDLGSTVINIIFYKK